MRRLSIILLILVSGCGFTSQGNLVRQGVKTYGAQAMDEGLANAEWFVCFAASVGSIRRKYGVSADRAAAYNDFCPASQTNPVLQDIQ